jgi:DNA repair exonuclease SbcCD ATPase subunit
MTSSFQDDEFYIDEYSAQRTKTHELPEPDIKFPLAPSRKSYENDSSCIVCGRDFNKVGISISKKDHCRFCYRGICLNCLNSYYFHSETRKLEKMCKTCQYKLCAMTEEFSDEIRQLRLERIQMRQEIELALKQKERMSKERQTSENKLASLQEDTSLSLNEKENIIKDLKNKQKTLQEQEEDCKKTMENSLFDLNLMSSRYSSLRTQFEEIKKKGEKDYVLLTKIKDEYNQIIAKKNALASEKNNENIKEDQEMMKIEMLRDEIVEYDKKITQMQDSLYERRFTFGDGSLSLEEEKRLEELREELKAAVEYIGTLKERYRQLSKSEKKQQMDNKESSRYEVSSELVESKEEDKNKEVSKTKRENEGNSVCKECSVI